MDNINKNIYYTHFHENNYDCQTKETEIKFYSIPVIYNNIIKYTYNNSITNHCNNESKDRKYSKIDSKTNEIIKKYDFLKTIKEENLNNEDECEWEIFEIGNVEIGNLESSFELIHARTQSNMEGSRTRKRQLEEDYNSPSYPRKKQRLNPNPMKAKPTSPTNEIIKKLVENKKITEALNLIKDERNKPHTRLFQEIDVVTYTTLIKGCFKYHQVDLVEKLVSQMPEDGIEPNSETYRTLIKGYAKNNNTEQVDKYLNIIKDNQNRFSKLNPAQCTKILKVFVEKDMIDQALKLYDIYKDPYIQNREKHKGFYHILLDALVEKGRIEKAMEIYRESGIEFLPSYNYNGQPQMDKNQNQWKDLHGGFTGGSAIIAIIDYFQKNPQKSQSLTVVPGKGSHSKDDLGFGWGKLKGAIGFQLPKIYDNLKVESDNKNEGILIITSKNNQPIYQNNFDTYKANIQHCTSNGHIDLAYYWLKEMENNNLSPTKDILDLLFFCKTEDNHGQKNTYYNNLIVRYTNLCNKPREIFNWIKAVQDKDITLNEDVHIEALKVYIRCYQDSNQRCAEIEKYKKFYKVDLSESAKQKLAEFNKTYQQENNSNNKNSGNQISKFRQIFDKK